MLYDFVKRMRRCDEKKKRMTSYVLP